MTGNKFWDFIPGEGGKPPELLVYGTISNWKDENTVTAKQFKDELDGLGDVPEIIVRINSGGGDVFAANAIFTQLKNSPAKITVEIDGWAASAATIIAMAGDTVKIARNGVFMIHDPAMVVFGSFQAGDFEKMAGELKVVKQSIVNAYWMKTKKSNDSIAALMEEETWMTGERAVEEGFCDELMFEEAQTDAEDGSKVTVNGIEIDISGFKNFPEGLLDRLKSTGCPAGGITCQSGPGAGSTKLGNKFQKEEKEMAAAENNIGTVDALKAAYPDLVATIQNEAAAAERNRIKAIEDMAGGNYADIVSDAKFEHPCTAEQVAVKIIAEQNKQGEQWLKDRAKDAEESGANGVAGNVSLTGENGKNPFDAAIDALNFD